ncbi:uncharacterized protein VTP21DRAFT_4726 [Calcarisporiella thermophila]|uniref:uncharacterized protein n=1 Tax=Calcarisporiella thermophila TaxID=911321 RepID=UPI003742151F
MMSSQCQIQAGSASSSATSGVYGTTPGGTRIVYDRNTLLMLSTSPLAAMAPKLPVVPGVTCPRNIRDAEFVDEEGKESEEGVGDRGNKEMNAGVKRREAGRDDTIRGEDVFELDI